MRIRPTELGWKGLLLLAALVTSFLASNYNNLFFLLIVFCSVLGALGLLWAWTNLRGLQCTHLDLPIAGADDPRPVRVILHVRQGGARGVVLSLVLATEVIELADALAIDPNGHVLATLPPRARSVAVVGAVRVSSRFPFGLFHARVDLPVDVALVTHPQPLPSQRPGARTPADDDSDELPAACGKRGSAIAGLRPFRDGDNLGDVHWKATARRGLPITREREPEAGGGLDFVLDRRCAAEVLERTLSRLTGLVLARRGSGRMLTVHSQGGGFTVRDDRSSEGNALRWLAAAATLPANAPAPPDVRGARPLPRTHGGPRG